jgi:hypothetical protein
MRIHPSIPKSFSDIDRVGDVNESFETPQYFNYLGPKEHAPSPKDFVGDTLINHPTDPEMYAVAMPDGRISRVHPDRADQVQSSARKAFQIGLRKAIDAVDSKFPDYTSKEQKVIHAYVKDSSINKDLIDGKKVDRMPLDDVISSHKAPMDMVVWSGTSKEHAAVLEASNSVHHPAFTSTSLSIRAANDFASKHPEHGDIMKIHVPKGHPCAYVRGDDHEGEREIILPRNIVINIDPSKEERMVTPKGTFRVHHCTIG